MWESVGEQLVENMIVALGGLLKRNTRLLEQVRLDVGAGDFASRTEMNANKFALFKSSSTQPQQ